MLTVALGSIWIHCGSEAALDQRVPVLPSTARLGVNAVVSFDDEVAGLFNARFVPAGTAVFVRVAVGPVGVLVRVGVREGVLVGPVAVFVRVAVGPTAVLVRVAVGLVPQLSCWNNAGVVDGSQPASVVWACSTL